MFRSAVVLIAALVLPASVLMAKDAKDSKAPSPKATPAAKSAPVDAFAQATEVMPLDAVGVLHVNPKLAAKDLLAAAGQKNLLPPAAIEGLGKIAGSIDSVDVFLLGENWSSTAPVVLVRGLLDPNAANAVVAAIPGLPEATQFIAVGNGRYSFPANAPEAEMIVGGEANDLPRGLTLIGARSRLTHDFIQSLKRNKSTVLADLATKINTTAPTWFVVDNTQGQSSPQPIVSLAGSVFVSGGGSSQVRVECKDANVAGLFPKLLSDPGSPGLLKILAAVMDLKIEGATVNLVSKSPEAMADHVIDAIIRQGIDAKRQLAMIYMANLAQGMAAYAQKHNNQLPPDLKVMVEDQHLSIGLLISPSSGKAPKPDEKGNFSFNSDFISISGGAIPNRECIIMFEVPQANNNEGAHVLYGDGRIVWLPIEDFNKEMAKTQEMVKAYWQKRQEAQSQPQSQPATK